jgi:acetolactate synthase-1/2/3 large subunit
MGWDRRLQPSEALLHVDVDPYEIGKSYRATVPLIGDAKSVLTELWYELRRQQGNLRPAAGRGGRFEAPPERLRLLNAAAMESDAVPITPQRLMRDLQDALPPDTLVFVDGGATRSWAIHYWRSFYPRTFFCATAMAAPGYGVAAAIGGKFAAPDRVVISIAGRSGFLMNGMEVSTAVRYNRQVIWIVLNPAGPGMAHHALRTLNLPDLGAPYARVDCARVADGMGAQGIHIREPGQINRELIGRIVESGRPTVLDIETDPDEAEPFRGPLAALGDVLDG